MDTEQTSKSDGSDLQRELRELYERYAVELVRYACSLSRNADAARDVVQEAFLRYFTERRFGRSIESPRAWLYVVTRNLLHQAANSTGQTTPAEVDIEKVADRSADPEILLQRSQMMRLIATVLSARESECLNLRLEGLGYSAIAAALGVHQGTVSTLLARVRSKVRRTDWGDRRAYADVLMRTAPL